MCQSIACLPYPSFVPAFEGIQVFSLGVGLNQAWEKVTADDMCDCSTVGVFVEDPFD